MKKIKTIDAVGHVLCHDITQIIKDVKMDRFLKKVMLFVKKILKSCYL